MSELHDEKNIEKTLKIYNDQFIINNKYEELLEEIEKLKEIFTDVKELIVDQQEDLNLSSQSLENSLIQLNIAEKELPISKNYKEIIGLSVLTIASITVLGLGVTLVKPAIIAIGSMMTILTSYHYNSFK
jgi:hypothetical protein